MTSLGVPPWRKHFAKTRFKALLFFSAAISGSAGAAPAPAKFDLTWRAPAACPKRSYVEQRIAKLLGAPPQATQRSSLEVIAEVVQDKAQTFTLRLVTRQSGQTWERPELSSASCLELANFTALVSAYLMNPDAASLLPAAPPVPPQPSPPKQKPPAEIKEQIPTPPLLDPNKNERPVRALPSENRRAPDESEPALDEAKADSLQHHSLIRMGALVEFGAHAGGAPGITGALGYELGRFRFELGGLFVPPRRHTVEAADGREKGATLSLASGSFGSCYALLVHEIELSACTRLQAGTLFARAFGIDEPRAGRATWLAIGAGPDLFVSMTRRLGLRSSAEAYLPLGQSRFIIDGLGTVHQLPSLAFQLALMAEAQLW